MFSHKWPSTNAVEAIPRLVDILRRITPGGLPDQMSYNGEGRVLVLHSWDHDASEYVRHGKSRSRAAAPIEELTAGSSHRWHIDEVRTEWVRQQELTIEQFRAIRPTVVDER